MPIFPSSTQTIPDAGAVPRHVAIIMDGNGRWARRRFLPRVAGHHRGVEAVRETLKTCLDRGIRYLTLFAFSSENWRRPEEEVTLLMQLFVRSLRNELTRMEKNGVRLKIVGDLSRFDAKLQAMIAAAEERTAGNERLTLTVAANYGGRWDILQAANRLALARPERVGAWQEEDLAPYLSMAYAPEPDLFIRTGGEERISNFLLWQLAYSEFYFTDTVWPDFDAAALDAAIASYRKRERRFGRTSEQLGGTELTAAQATSPMGSVAADGQQSPADGRRYA
ncbi:polyprenyl diphosphate synthase [Rhodocyclus tenuis]|uniref:Isoprenyl transferase n=1 Tax=Rhodocyclus tenuis TaxID=1066 RepID=A0A840FY63_RHOTE|nr:polyprenyl diphosphate synthase [Rhodocyclus tenuis]MBB4247067.1 undecaprenyl diphosphate synthase [Rhodocyclus tenuis]